jgi:release factor glutamine methyltransferase
MIQSSKFQIFPPKRISDALFWCTKKLINIENPKFEAEVLLAEILDKDRSFLRTHSDSLLDNRQRLKLRHWIQKRAKHIPIAYIQKYKLWNDLKIGVNKNTLIPRDETEILAQKIVEQNSSSTKNILDIGTGSGCLAIFLKKSFPTAEVSGIDISRKALFIAKKNATQLKQIVHFFYSNLLQKIDSKLHFDIIVANLPYVPESIKVSKEVQKEPRGAIFAGDNGLALIQELKEELETKKITFGQLWLEFLPQQKEAIQEIFKSWNCDFQADIGGDVFFVKITP